MSSGDSEPSPAPSPTPGPDSGPAPGPANAEAVSSGRDRPLQRGVSAENDGLAGGGVGGAGGGAGGGEMDARAYRDGEVQARRGRVVIAVFVISVAVQIVMVILGVTFISADDDDSSLFSQLLWCTLGTSYAVVAVLLLGILSRLRRTAEGRPSRLELSLPVRVISFIGTFSASLVGVVAAVQLLTLRNDPNYGPLFNVVGVWAMLLSWGFLHWGFAQIYQQNYFRSATPPMRFPNTPNPGVVDFVYFAYTLGTSFAASDVEVLSTRLRYTVVWHSVLSFFFNGLIVVLALNTILSMGAVASS
ncbi:MAG: hypothetical protein JWQ19_1909 [Subtercola sp.]|nr:hypothetical protein [Subtercola sp.]